MLDTEVYAYDAVNVVGVLLVEVQFCDDAQWISEVVYPASVLHCFTEPSLPKQFCYQTQPNYEQRLEITEKLKSILLF